MSVWFAVFLGLSVGIFAARYAFWFIMLPVIAGGMVLLFKTENYRSQVGWGMLALAGGALYFHMTYTPVPRDLPEAKNTVMTGKIDDYPQYDGDKSKFVVANLKPEPYLKKVQVFCYFDSRLRKGDVVELHGALTAPARPGNPGEFDYPAYLSYSGIYYIMGINRPGDVKVINPASGALTWLNNYRQRGIALIKKTLPRQEAAITLGMLLGITEDIDKQEYSDFQKTGIIHLYSVSGFHVTFLVLLCTWLVSLAGLSKRLSFWGGTVLLLLYATLVGWPVCVVRAVIMAFMASLARYLGRDSDLLNSLGLAGLVIVLINPGSLFQISFQLTFLATWGLVYLYPQIKKRWPYKQKWWDLLLVPACAQLATFPAIAAYFNLISPVSILTNILVSYLAGGVVILGFIALIIGSLTTAGASIFLYPTGAVIELIRLINTSCAAIPGAYTWVATPAWALIGVYYLGLFLFIYGLRIGRGPKTVIPGILMMAVFVFILYLPANLFNRGIMEVVFIDVGQGDSILVKSPQGKFILVDGGGSEISDVGMRKVLPYLRHRGIRKLYAIINTHPDIDHIQGLETIVREMPVGFAAIPDSLAGYPQYRTFKKLLQGKNIPLYILAGGQGIQWHENMSARVIYSGEKGGADDTNNNGLVLDISYRDFSVLLTADVGSKTLQKLVTSEKLHPVTVLKIPHHGSKGSLCPALYHQVQPRWAVISVGANNRYGLPTPEVLNILTKQHINVLRTDISGALAFYSNGRTVQLKTGTKA